MWHQLKAGKVINTTVIGCMTLKDLSVCTSSHRSKTSTLPTPLIFVCKCFYLWIPDISVVNCVLSLRQQPNPGERTDKATGRMDEWFPVSLQALSSCVGKHLMFPWDSKQQLSWTLQTCNVKLYLCAFLKFFQQKGARTLTQHDTDTEPVQWICLLFILPYKIHFSSPKCTAVYSQPH